MIFSPVKMAKILLLFVCTPFRCSTAYRFAAARTYALHYYRPDICKSGFRYTASLSLVLFFFMTSLNAEVFVKYNEKNDKVVISALSEQQAPSKQGASKHESSDQPVEKKTANNGLKYHVLYAEQWEIVRTGESILSLPILNKIINAWLNDRQKKIEIQYPGGEEGEFWVQELTDWLVSLGIPSNHMVISPGSGADDVINFTLIK
ncbi:MAG: hypothetical protein DRQ44_02705 [Gammaproteobacteria bacterium]|nr:MAG: hypothetical protein DRQ44_02705 [Gammaproteobacteria bacterium]